MEKAILNKQNLSRPVLKVKRLPHFKGEFPAYQSASASGFDIRAQIELSLLIKPFSRVLVPTGLIFEIPEGFELQVRPRSGLALKKGLSLPNSPGTIDSDYRGELKIILINLSEQEVIVKAQQRIAQVVLCPVFQARLEWAEELTPTERGIGGFGSTGV